MKILLIAENTKYKQLIKEVLKEKLNKTWLLAKANTLTEGDEKLKINNYPIVLLDSKLPGNTHTDIIHFIKTWNQKTAVIVL
ncbi:MAG: hypothetical protein R6T91_04680, partial [Bacteroidales bacterium]